MAYVEIDLCEVDFDDLVREVIDQLKENSKYRTPIEKKLLRELVKESAIAIKLTSLPEVTNLKDELKLEYAKELMEKYSEEQLREMEKDYLNKKTR
jgi:hypothetical protein